MLRGTAAPPEGTASSRGFEPPQAGLHEPIQASEFLAKIPAPLGCQPVRAAPVVRLDGADPAPFFEARDGAVQGTGAEADTGKSLNVVDHRVAVLVAIGKAREDEQRGIRRHYYVARNIVARNSWLVNTGTGRAPPRVSS